MPFNAKANVDIPNKDILSWYFDDPQYDLKKKIYIDAANPDRYYTGESAKSTIRKLAAGLRANGLKEGDCVCLHSFNNVNFPIIANGIVAIGGIFAGTNPSYNATELDHHLKTAHVKLIISEANIVKNITKAAEKSGVSTDKIFILNAPDEEVPKGYKSWTSLLEHGEEDWVRFDDKKKAESKLAALLFSSGTTGLPKAAEYTHKNLIAQCTLVVESMNKKEYEPKRLAMLPMFHAAAVPVTHYTPLRTGMPTYIMQRFSLEPWLENVQKYKITEVAMVPPIVMSIINSEAKDKYDLSSIKMANCGAAPLDAGPQSKFQALLGKGAPFTQVWGMTEGTCTIAQFPYPEDDDTGSIGYIIDGLDVKLVDDNNKDITDYDVRGEICYRGPTVINGYYENDEANKDSFDKEGYFHSGDIGYCDKKTKKWYIVDRKKDLIKVRGFQVAPPELEAVLLDIEGIVDAAVIGVTPSKDDSEEFPRAYVVCKQGAEVTEDTIRNTFKEKLAKYKQLEGGIKFMDEIPKNASGKILKKDLREMAKKEMGSKL